MISSLPSSAFLTSNGRNSIESPVRKWWHSSLHSNFYGFERTETNVGNEFSRGTSGKVKHCFIFGGSFFAGEIGISLLEIFVESVFGSALDLKSPC